jgi:hypothetical protein
MIKSMFENKFLSIILSLLITIPGLNTTAQIVITSSDMQEFYTPGKRSINYLGSGSTIINVGKTGGPNTYDFTTLSFTPQPISTCLRVSEIPLLIGHYPDSAVIFSSSQQIVKNTAVFLFTPAALLDLGSVNVSVFSDTQYYHHNVPSSSDFVFPLFYEQTWSITTAYYDTTYINSVPIQTGFSNASYTIVLDGYGILRIPGYELQCLRMKSTSNTGGKSRFWFLTKNGSMVYIETNSSQPDTGDIVATQYMYGMAESPIGVTVSPQFPIHFILFQNYPNPFNPSTAISYSIPKTSLVTIKVYDVLGKEIATLINEEKPAGNYNINFDGSNLTSGVYFYRMQAGNFSETKKLILLR